MPVLGVFLGRQIAARPGLYDQVRPGNRGLTQSAAARRRTEGFGALVWTPLTGNRYLYRWGPARSLAQFWVSAAHGDAARHSLQSTRWPAAPGLDRGSWTAGRRCHAAVRRAAFDLGPVPERGSGRQAGHGRALDRIDRRLGDRDRQIRALCAHPPRHGRLRAGVLVGAIAGRALPLAGLAADPLDGSAVRRCHAG